MVSNPNPAMDGTHPPASDLIPAPEPGPMASLTADGEAESSGTRVAEDAIAACRHLAALSSEENFGLETGHAPRAEWFAAAKEAAAADFASKAAALKPFGCPEDLRGELLRAAAELDAVSDRNRALLAGAIDARLKVLDVVSACARAASPGAGGYGRNGAVRKGRSASVATGETA